MKNNWRQDILLGSLEPSQWNKQGCFSNFCFLFFSENPRSLQDSCRFVIREALGAKRLEDIAKLPVSNIMKEFLLYKYD